MKYSVVKGVKKMNAYLIKCLKEGRLKKGLKQSDVTKLTGIKNTTLSNYENGVSEPDIDTFLSLCKLYDIDYVKALEAAYGKSSSEIITKEQKDILTKYKAIDDRGKDMVNTVLNKEYERHTESIKPKLKETYIQNPKVIEFDPEEVETITLKHSEYKASAGTGYILFDDCREEDLKVIFNNLTRKADICIDVYGNSMEPKYYDGDILLIRKQPDVEIGEIGIFIIDDKGFVKKKGTEGLISINKDYDIIPKSEDIKCFGKVLGVLEKEWIR